MRSLSSSALLARRAQSLPGSALLARRAHPHLVSTPLSAGVLPAWQCAPYTRSLYKKRPCARWIRVPGRGSLWLLPPGPDQVRNISSPEPIERARRLVYGTRFHRRRLGKHRLTPTEEKPRHARLCILGIYGTHCGMYGVSSSTPSPSARKNKELPTL